LLNANDFGLPQNRERIFIIASKIKYFEFEQLQKIPRPKLKDFLDKEGDFEFLTQDEYTLIKNPKVQSSGLIFVGYRNGWKKGIRENTSHLSRVHRQPNRIYSIHGIHPTIPSQESSGRFFILSTWHHNDYRENKYIKSIWKEFNILTREHFYHVGASEKNRSPMIEAIITNYDTFPVTYQRFKNS